jgi:osmotically-inducible protein OsmY
MRDRDWYGQDRGRWGRDDDDDRWMSDEERRWRGQQRYPEQTYGGRNDPQRGGYGQREYYDRGELGGYGGGGYGHGGYGGEGYRGGGYGGGGQRNYGREADVNREWSPGGDVRRRDYPSSFGGGGGYYGGEWERGYQGRREEGRGSSTGFYGQRMDRASERNYGVGYSGYGEEQHRGDDDRGLLERAGDWLQRKLGKAPKGYQRSDERIREDVCDLIMRRGDLDASDVTVLVASGEVTLTGTVRDRHTKRRLEDLTEDVLGVNDVHNQIKVRREGEPTTSASTLGTTTAVGAPAGPGMGARGNDVNVGARQPGGSNDKSNRA